MRLTEAEARARLAAARVARLATVGSDGQPHLVPVTFAIEGDLIYTAVDHKPKSTHNLRRLRNIGENPRVALLADHYEEDWDALWWVRVDGRAEVFENSHATRHQLDVLAERYEQYRRALPEGPVIVIAALRWTGWAGTPGRLSCRPVSRGPVIPRAGPPAQAAGGPWLRRITPSGEMASVVPSACFTNFQPRR